MIRSYATRSASAPEAWTCTGAPKGSSDGEQFVAVVAARADFAVVGDVAGGFEQAEGVHHVFGVVALSVCLRALVARFVTFRQPSPTTDVAFHQ